MKTNRPSLVKKTEVKRRRTFLKAVVFSGIALGTLIVLTYAAINYWGRNQWNATKNELLAAGEPLSLSELLPSDVPDEQNFFATPPWSDVFALYEQRRSKSLSEEDYARLNPLRPLEVSKRSNGSMLSLASLGTRGAIFSQMDRQTDLEEFAQSYKKHGIVQSADGPAAEVVLRGLERGKPLLADLEVAAARPLARPRTLIDFNKLFETPMPYLAPAMTLAQTLQLRAVARMTTGDSPGAASDILLILRMAEAFQSDPFMISKLVRMSCLGIAMSALWETTAIGHWKAEDLEKIQRALDAIHPAQDMITALRAERGMFNQWLAQHPDRSEIVRIFQPMPGMLEWYIRLCPEGIFLADQALLNRFHQAHIDILRTGEISALSQLPPGPGNVWRTPLSTLASSSISSITARGLNVQSQLDLARTACALERFRLAQGSLPVTLDALVPKFLEKVPLDPDEGRPIGYLLVSPDNYELTCKAILSKSRFDPPGGFWTWSRKH